MNRFGSIIRMVNSLVAEVKSIGGVTQDRFVSPKGLYSKPIDEEALIIPLSKGNSQDIVFSLQEEVELNDGDVYVTDDSSYIHFHFDGEAISLKTKDLVFDCESFVVNASSVDFNGCTIKNDGVSIDKGHTHPQNNGNDNGGGANTGSPNN